MIVPVMAISNLVLTRQIYSEETNGTHAHYREPVPLTLRPAVRIATAPGQPRIDTETMIALPLFFQLDLNTAANVDIFVLFDSVAPSRDLLL